MSRLSRAVVATFALAAACAGQGPTPWALRSIGRAHTFPARDGRGREIPGGIVIGADDLDTGRMAYVHYCSSCHGLDGDGKGPAGGGLDPPPRDFRAASFKFAAVRSGELPNDADLVRMVQHGMSGTAMPAWGIPEEEVRLIVQFLKTFPAPGGGPNRWQATVRSGPRRGRPRPTGEPVEIGRDPWRGREREAVRLGRRIYQVKAQCASCHPSYVSAAEHATLAREAGLLASAAIRPRPHEPLVLEAAKNPYGVDLEAPDFTADTLRSIRPAQQARDICRVVAAGVGGVMPSWIDSLPMREIWSLAHYVETLARLSRPGHEAARRAFRRRLTAGRGS